jgi:hypothetical protein
MAPILQPDAAGPPPAQRAVSPSIPTASPPLARRRRWGIAWLLGAALASGCGSAPPPPAPPAAVSPPPSAPFFLTFQKGDRLVTTGVALPDDGSVVAVGRVDTVVGWSWPWAVKVDRGGSVAWEREWKSASGGDHAGFLAVTEIPGGDVIAAGTSGPLALAARIAPNGETRWARTLRFGENTATTSVIAGEGDGVLVAGTVRDLGTRPSIFVARLNADGSVVSNEVVAAGESMRVAALGGDGYVVISGYDVIRLDRSMKVVWSRRIDGAWTATGVGDGGVAVATFLSGRSSRPRVARLRAGGGTLWELMVGRACGNASVWFEPPSWIAAVGDACDQRGEFLVTWLSADGVRLSEERVPARTGAFAYQMRRDGPGFVAVGAFLQDDRPEARQGWVFRSPPLRRPEQR